MRVKLTYFKWTGKVYDEAEYETANGHSLLEIWNEVERFQSEGKLPGLVESPQGYRSFYILVDVPEHPSNHPHLILARDSSALEFMRKLIEKEGSCKEEEFLVDAEIERNRKELGLDRFEINMRSIESSIDSLMRSGKTRRGR